MDFGLLSEFLRNQDSTGPSGCITLGLDLGLTEQVRGAIVVGTNPGPWAGAPASECPDSQDWPELVVVGRWVGGRLGVNLTFSNDTHCQLLP